MKLLNRITNIAWYESLLRTARDYVLHTIRTVRNWICRSGASRLAKERARRAGVRFTPAYNLSTKRDVLIASTDRTPEEFWLEDPNGRITVFAPKIVEDAKRGLKK